MRDSDLGITRAARGPAGPDGSRTPPAVHHETALTPLERRAVETLGDWSLAHPGRHLAADTLAAVVFDGRSEGHADDLVAAKRDLRRLVNHLIELHEIPIAPLPGIRGGYRLARTVDEVAQAVGPHLRRVRTGLRKIVSLRASAEVLTQELAQLALGLPEPVAAGIHEALGQGLGRLEGRASRAQVRRALAAYQADPDRYAGEIRELAQQFGGLFVSREALEEILLDEARASAGRVLGRLGGGDHVNDAVEMVARPPHSCPDCGGTGCKPGNIMEPCACMGIGL